MSVVARFTPIGEYLAEPQHLRLPDAQHSELGLLFAAWLQPATQLDPELLERVLYRNRKNRKPHLMVMTGLVTGHVEICHEFKGEPHAYYVAKYAQDDVGASIRPIYGANGFHERFIKIGHHLHQSELEEDR